MMTLFPNLLSYWNVPDEIQIWRKEISVKAVHQISRNMFYFYLLNLLSLIFRKLQEGTSFRVFCLSGPMDNINLTDFVAMFHHILMVLGIFRNMVTN